MGNNLTVPSSEEVRSEAIQTLITRMGITKAAMFIRESMSQKTDYLKTKQKLYGNKSAAQLYEEMKESRDKSVKMNSEM